MKKLLMVLIPVVLIAVIACGIVGKYLAEKYSYSQERADLYDYFKVSGKEEVAIVLQDERLEEKAVLSEGRCYFNLDTVQKYFNDRFYVDRVEGLLIYTTPTEVIRAELGSAVYAVDGAETDAGYPLSFVRGEGPEAVYYIAVDYVKQYTNFSYEVFQEPMRMQVYNRWPERRVAQTSQDSAVRVLGGIKSPILCDVAAGDTLVVLEKMDTWCKVKTLDGVVGYIENKMLEEERQETPVPVTDYREPEYTSLTREKKIALGWHAIYSTAGNDSLGEVVAGASGMTVISPTWFSMSDNEGNFQSFAQQSYVDKAHAMGLEVWAAADNFNYKNNNGVDVDTQAVLAATATRTKLARGVVDAALEYGLDGINIDFEEIGAEYGEDYIQFLREISILCRKNNLVLSVDVPVPFHYNQQYDLAEQGVVADYVIIMGYDEHGGSSTEAGSVASIGYISQGLENALEMVPSHKLVNALPFYTRLWKTEGTSVTSRAYGMSAVRGVLSEYGMTAQWDEETQQNYASKKEGDALYEMWVEDLQSILAKINVMKKHDLGGVAAWRLGFESQGIWEVLKAYINS